MRLVGVHDLLESLAHLIDRTSHPGLQLVYDYEIFDITARSAALPIPVLKYVLVSFYVRRPYDLFPVIRWIPPQCTLWISLDSTGEGKVTGTMRRVNGEGGH